jgi:copper homeostasis protein CutC
VILICYPSAVIEFIGKFPIVQDYINVPPLSIVRIRQGDIGFAYNKSEVEVLLPGLSSIITLQ